MSNDLARIDLTLYKAIDAGDEKAIKEVLSNIIKISHEGEVGVEFVERILKVRGIEIGDHLKKWLQEAYDALENA